MKNIICPISDKRINENVTRINAFLTIVILVFAFMLNSLLMFSFLMIDFFIRAFTEKYSPINFVSNYIINISNLPIKMIDKAPKIFAARLGFLMTTIIVALTIFKMSIATMIVVCLLIFFASLEFIFSICVGCMIYTYMVLPFYKK